MWPSALPVSKEVFEDEKAMATSRHNQQIYWEKFVRPSNIPKKSVKERDPCLLTTSSSSSYAWYEMKMFKWNLLQKCFYFKCKWYNTFTMQQQRIFLWVFKNSKNIVFRHERQQFACRNNYNLKFEDEECNLGVCVPGAFGLFSVDE